MTLGKLVLHEPIGTKYRRTCWDEGRYIEYDPILNIWINDDRNLHSFFNNHLDAEDWEIYDANPWKPIQEFVTGKIFIIDTFPSCLYKWGLTDKGRSLWIKTPEDKDWRQCKFNTCFNEAQGKLYKK